MGQTVAKPFTAGKGHLTLNENNELYGVEHDVPDDILWEILIRVPAKDIVQSCVLVCKQWHDIIESKTFWKHKCVTVHKYSRELTHILANENFKKLYFLNPYKTNLIRNSSAEMGLKHWKVTSNGGDGWEVETPTGCDPIVEYTHNSQTQDVKCWVTSYSDCTKKQTIDLVERGCSTYILDEIRPDICISEWYAGRFDCAMKYTLHVQLLGTKKDKTPIKEWYHGTSEPAALSWYKAEHRFSDYEPGVRYIRYIHSGADRQFWKGWYGAKMTLSSVELEFSHSSNDSTKLKNSSES